MPRAKPKPNKAKVDPSIALALATVPAIQVANGRFEICDVSNHSDGDQRHMVRSGQRKTVRRLTKIEKMAKAGIIGQREAAACEWYAGAHACRYDTTGITARYGESNGESNGGGCTSFDHLPKTREQEDALWHFDDARQSISPMVRPMFERVVLHGRPLGKLALTFRMAARQLLSHIEGKVAL